MELVDHSHDAVLPPTFGASLRAARLRRNVTLDAVAARTKLNRVFFQDLERNDLSKWPASQFYRESYLRAYCKAVGLDEREVIDGFRRELTAGAASSTAAASTKPRRLTPVTIPIILAVTFVVFYTAARWLAPSLNTPAAEIAEPAEPPAPVAATEIAPSAVPAPPEPVNGLEEERPAEVPAVVPDQRVEGTLVITSTPPGATVLVNGINRGTTPVQVQHLPAGSHTIRFIHAGLTSVTRRATISANRRQVQVSAELEPSPPVPSPSEQPVPEQ